MKLIPKNWKAFQHYNKRRPPWIKLHHNLLDDYDFARLPVASKALAPLLWLLASESDDGSIDLDAAALCFRLRMTDAELVSGLKPLIDSGFFVDASGKVQDASIVLASRKQSATPETERETEAETEIPVGANTFAAGGIREEAPVDSVNKAVYAEARRLLGSSAGGLITPQLGANGKGIGWCFEILADIDRRRLDPEAARAYFSKAAAPKVRGFVC